MLHKDFLSIRDFMPDDVRHFLQMACQVKSRPEQFAESLKGKTLAMIFEKPSLRTRVTFDVGMEQLGGHAVYLSPAEINLGKRESVHDVAKNLERMVQGIMIRTFAHDIVVDMAKHAAIPVINGLTDYSHPCQALADYLTMMEVKGRIAGLKVAYIGDGNNVARSLMFAGAQLGANVWVATPPGFQPDAESLEWCRHRCVETRGAVTVTSDPEMACFNADVVYTDVWASMGQESDAERRQAAFPLYQVNTALMRHARSEAIFLHCLPAHRGMEVTDEVIDSPQSFVFQQAENRLHVQKAILLELMWDKAVDARPVRMAEETLLEMVR